MTNFNLIQSNDLSCIIKLNKDSINEGFGGCDEYGISYLPYPKLQCSFFDEATKEAFYGETKEGLAIVKSVVPEPPMRTR